jgi:hypothetical protein
VLGGAAGMPHQVPLVASVHLMLTEVHLIG